MTSNGEEDKLSIFIRVCN